MSSTAPSAASFAPMPRASAYILGAGTLVALLDIALATGFWNVSHGIAPTRILQSVASGLMGAAAFEGGAASAALGAVLHLGIAFAMAAVYWFAARRIDALRRRWIAAGTGYGVLLHLAMNLVVVPLSQAASPAFWWPWFAASLSAHIVLVGLPLAYFARRPR